MSTRVPSYAITDGTYWPNGKGTIPLPVEYPDNGGVYAIIDIASAGAGDSLDTLVFYGVSLIGAPVAMTAGDNNQSALDVLAAIEAHTSMLFSGNVVGGRIVVNRTDGQGAPTGDVSFTATTGSGTVITADVARWVIQENTSDGIYYLMDALDPGVNVADTISHLTLATYMWVYIPLLHTVHRVTSYRVAGGPIPLASLGAYWHLRLEPEPATSPGTQYIVKLLPPQYAGVNIKNIGGATGKINDDNFINGQEFDRSISSRQLRDPLTYDSTGTSFAITMNT